jgi:Arc/MetJ family transcription regulator
MAGKRSTRQVSVTIDAAVLAEVERRLKSEKTTLSAYVSEALAERIRREKLRAALEAFEHEHGAITAEELARARSHLSEPARSKRRRAA